MFKFLKEKLKGAVSSFKKKAEEESVEKESSIQEVREHIKESVEEKVDKEEKKGFFSFFKKKKPELLEEKKRKEKKEEAIVKEEKIILEEPPKVEKEVKKRIEEEVVKEEKKLGIFGKIKEKVITKRISEEKFNELFEELELVLLENNVAFEVVEKLKEDLKKSLVDKPILRKEMDGLIETSLKNSIDGLFIDGFDIIGKIKEKKPYIIVFVGINGSGKTTTLAKIANLLLENKKTCVIAAADTFRAASIQQLEEHGKKLGVKIIKHDYGSDAGAVAFDAIKHAEAKNIDVVLIDTAGRLHSNKDLMREMEKIVRVAKPDLKLFVGEAITGNDCIIQSIEFDKAIGIDGIILTKADVDEKGGTMISVSYITGKPILYLGYGQLITDLKKFNKDIIIKNLGF